jgi:hypothetical protein
VCPECGNPLSVIFYGKPLAGEVPVSRVHLEKCEKCADNIYAVSCFTEIGKNPDHCHVCRCRSCCAEAAAVCKRLRKGEVTLSQLFADNIRERRERKEREAKELGVEVEAAKPGPMAGILGNVFDDEIPF